MNIQKELFSAFIATPAEHKGCHQYKTFKKAYL